MPLLERADVLDALEKAMSSAAVDITTVPMDGQFIRKSENKVKGNTEATVISGATRSCVSHHTACPKKVERAICLWLEDKTQEGLSSVERCEGNYTKSGDEQFNINEVKSCSKTLISR